MKRHKGRALRKRYKQDPDLGLSLERITEDAQRNANTTRTPWVVVYRPRNRRYWDYNLTTLRRTPIEEPHEIVATLYPK